MNCVRQKVRDHLRQTFGVAKDFRRREVAKNLQPVRGRERNDEFHAIFDDGGQVNFSTVQIFLPGVEARKFEQRIGEPPHLLRDVQTGGEGLLVFGCRAFAGQRGLRLGNQHRQRRAQLVGGVGGELFLLRERGFEAREGGIQNTRKLAQFAFRFRDADALGQIAGGNFCGGGADFFHGPQRAGDDEPRAAQPKCQHHQAAEPKPAGKPARIRPAPARACRPTRMQSPNSVA